MEQTTAISVGIRIILNAAQKAGVRMGEAPAHPSNWFHPIKRFTMGLLRLTIQIRRLKTFNY